MAAIDCGIIKRNISVQVIDECFGTDYAHQPTRDPTWGTVRFVQPQPVNPHPEYASEYVGWELAFQYDRRGLVWQYHLTNLHK